MTQVGHTLTKDVSFRHVCEAIRDTAFISSDLPVIVSLESHTSHDQQAIMVDIIEEVWKGFLLDPSSENSQQTGSLPCPGELRNKILIKVKYTPPEATGGLRARRRNDTDSTSPSSSDEKEQRPKGKMLHALSRLGVYTRAYHFNGFDQPEAKLPEHIFSLSEAALATAQEEQGSALFYHNRNFLMRTFPKGLRVDSSNLDPSVCWRHGVQIVALNWQSWDKGIMLNEAMFADSKGWVLKPEGFRGDGHQPSDVSIRPLRLDLTVEVFAGENIPLPPDEKKAKGLAPYVICEVITGAENLQNEEKRTGTTSNAKDREKRKGAVYKQKTVTYKGDNRTNPDFGRQKLGFKDVPDVIEALTFVR